MTKISTHHQERPESEETLRRELQDVKRLAILNSQEWLRRNEGVRELEPGSKKKVPTGVTS